MIVWQMNFMRKNMSDYNFKIIRRACLSCALLTTLLFLKTECLNTLDAEQLPTEIKHQKFERNKKSLDSSLKKAKRKKFQLSDFEGYFIYEEESIGGVDGGVGKSGIVHGLIQFDKFGNGKVIQEYGILYFGVPTEFFNFSYLPTTGKVVVTIIDAKNGIARFTFTESVDGPAGALVGPLFLNRNPGSKKIESMTGHLDPAMSPASLPNNSLQRIKMTRQN